MKTIPQILILTAVLWLQTTALYCQKKLTILHTNDTHSCIYPLSEQLADTMLAGRGGYLRRIALIDTERQSDPSLLLLDSGDFSQGSPYYTLFKGNVETDLMNRMGYDAATIGNHEFDFGLENMARIFRRAHFPIVCSNYDFAGTTVEGIVKPYIILKRNGLRIGIFGLSPELDGLVDENKCKGVRYLDPVATANQMSSLLRRKRCDLIVCLSHLGWDDGGTDDQRMVAGSHGIDIVLGGHSHSYLQQLEYLCDADGRKVAIDQNGKHAVFVGKLILTMKP